MTTEDKNRYKSLIWPSVITIPALFILLCLGTWQVQRLAYKTELLSQIDTRIDLEPVALPKEDDWSQISKDTWNFTPVTLTGVFDHKQEFHVFTHISDDKGRFQQAGYLVVTPLKLSNSETYIFISRGFVPEILKEPAKRPEGQITETIQIEGILRFPERANVFTPDPDLTKNIWFVRDTQGMQKLLSDRTFAPFFVELKRSVPQVSMPISRAVKPEIKNNHLSYAITWYGMALALLVIFIVYCLRQLKERKQS